MKAPSTKIRFQDAQKLLDFGFSNYSYVSFAKKDTILKELPVNKGTDNKINVIYAEDAGCVLPKGMDKNIEQVVTLPNLINAPVEAYEKVGEIQFLLNGEVIGSTNLVSDSSVKKLNLGNISEKVFSNWFRVLR